MRFMRYSLAALFLLALSYSPAHAEKNLNFGSNADHWFEVTASGGWSLYQSAANSTNINGGSKYLFDDGTRNNGAWRFEMGWGSTDKIAWAAGLWYGRSTDEAVSTEVTDPAYVPAPNDEFQYYRSVKQIFVAPYASARYFFRNDRTMRYFLSGGGLIGVSRATLSFRTQDLASGELHGDRDIGDTKLGFFASLGLRRLISSSISFGAEAGYRYVGEMTLSQEQFLVESPPLGPVALAVTDILDVNYSGPFAMVSVTLRP